MRMLALKSAHLTEISKSRTYSGMAEFKSRDDTVRTQSFSVYQLYLFL